MSEAETGLSTSEAPETQTVATPENVATPETQTEDAQGEQTQAEKTKSFSQTELDSIIQKEKAKAEARAERRALKVYAEKLESMSKPVQQPTAQPDGKPTMAQYANVEDYVEAVADWKLYERDRESQIQQIKQNQKTVYDKTEKIYQEAEKIQGFDRSAFDELPLTTPIAQAIIESNVAAKLMAYLANNPSETDRIATLSYVRQAAEIGKLEVKLTTAPKVSNAPVPITPIGNGQRRESGLNDNLSIEEWLSRRNKQVYQR